MLLGITDFNFTLKVSYLLLCSTAISPPRRWRGCDVLRPKQPRKNFKTCLSQEKSLVAWQKSLCQFYICQWSHYIIGVTQSLLQLELTEIELNEGIRKITVDFDICCIQMLSIAFSHIQSLSVYFCRFQSLSVYFSRFQLLLVSSSHFELVSGAFVVFVNF